MARKNTPSSSTPSKTPSKTAATSGTPSSQQPIISSKTSSTTIQHQSSSSKTLAPLSSNASPLQVAQHVWSQYLQDTPPRTLWLDSFMAYCVVIGGLQFLYALLGGNYPFNAFLSAFSAAVGQFVLLASLRLQITEKLPQTASSDAVREAKKQVEAGSGDTVVQGPDVGVVEGEEKGDDYTGQRAWEGKGDKSE